MQLSNEICENIKDFVREELFPLESKIQHEDFNKTIVPILEEKRAIVKKEGWWAPHMGTSLGGMGLSLLELARVGEILGQTPIGHYVFGCQAPDAGNMEVLHQFGTEEQKQNYLHPLVRGDIRSCFSMTEPDFAGSNPIHMATTAVRDGGEYVINGHKWFTTGADSAAFAIVMVVTNPENGKYNQAS